jgi:anaerobic selenocysteine-containing dehydrogenase
MNLTRRGFIGWTGAVAAAAAGAQTVRAIGDLQAATYEAEVLPQGIEGRVASVCQQCPGGCGILVRTITGVEDGVKRAVKIEGNPHHPISRGNICPKGVAGIQALYDPDRFRGPMKRVGARGQGQWQPVSWDEAIATVVQHLQDLRATGEAHTLLLMAGQIRGLMQSLVLRFLEAYGSPNYLSTASGFDAARQTLLLTQGVAEPIAYDLENSAYILSFGANLLEAGWSPVRQARAYGHLRQGTPGRRGRLVQVEPRLSVTAAKADEWIPVRPGTDGALALAMAHVIVSEGLFDREFVETWTFGFEDWRDPAGASHLGFRSLVLNDYRPEAVSALTGVPIQTIVRVAREFAATRPAVALAERGAGFYTNGLYNRLAIHALNALVGSIEVQGGTVTQRRPPFTPLTPVTRDTAAVRGLAAPRIDGAGYPALSGLGAAKSPLTSSALPSLPEALRTGSPYRANALFLYYANPAYSVPEFVRSPDLLNRIPFIVSFSPFPDETSRYADLILPDHTYLERWQDDPIEATWGPAVLGLRQPAISPRHQTRHTGDVLIQIAQGLGGAVAAAFPWKDFSEVLKDSFREVAGAQRGLIMTSPFEEARQRRQADAGFWLPTYKTFDEFWNQVAERGGWWDPAYPFGDRERAFRTPSGKFEFFSQTLRQRLDALARRGPASGGGLDGVLRALDIRARGDRVFLPHHEAPRFVGEEKEFPLHFIMSKPMSLASTRTANQAWLAEIPDVRTSRPWEIAVEINPETAHKLGVKDGDEVWLESPAGRLRLRARLYQGIAPEVVHVPFGSGHGAGGRFAEAWGANPNRLVGGEADRLAGTPALFATRVRITKV